MEEWRWYQLLLAGLGTAGAGFIGVFTLVLKHMITRTNERIVSLEQDQRHVTVNMVTREELRNMVERLENRNHDDLKQIHARLDALMMALAQHDKRRQAQ